MTSTRPSRISKSVVLQNITEMVEMERHFVQLASERRTGKLFIRIPAHIWNSRVSASCSSRPIAIANANANATATATSDLAIPNPTQPKPKLKLKLRFPPSPRRAHKRANKPPRAPISVIHKQTHHLRSTDCKIPLYRFHPPGPNHTRGGKRMNDITLEGPCLQETCNRCTSLYPQLVGEPMWLVPKPVVESLSPVIDPQLLDNTPSKFRETKAQEKRRVSSVSVLELTSPVFPALQPVGSMTRLASLVEQEKRTYDVFLPTKLVQQAIQGNVAARTGWRSEPRRRYTVELKVHTKEGRQRFKDIVEGGSRRGILKEALSGANKRKRATISGIEVADGERHVKRVRFRHRVRLVFGPGEGRRKFAELVQARGW